MENSRLATNVVQPYYSRRDSAPKFTQSPLVHEIASIDQ
jgi:hypothetical protein